MMFREYFNSIREIINSHSADPDYKAFGLSWSEEQIQSALKTGNIRVFPSDSENIQSFLIYRKINEFLYEIDLTMTQKASAQKGMMSSLFYSWKKELPSGVEIWLEVHERNQKAINLYKKWGFSVVGKREKYYPDGGAAMLFSLKTF